MIEERTVRNSGAVLEPVVWKHGPGTFSQGMKMRMYRDVFAPVLAVNGKLDGTEEGYFMPQLADATTTDYVLGMQRLEALWTTKLGPFGPAQLRTEHHFAQVVPLCANSIWASQLDLWFQRTRHDVGRSVVMVHGDPTLENVMADGLWLDPSTRPLPMEAELDGGKLLQSYFGYGQEYTSTVRCTVRNFLHYAGLNLDLCAYYLVTHLVRLCKVQPWARSWADDLVLNLESRMEEVKCR